MIDTKILPYRYGHTVLEELTAEFQQKGRAMNDQNTGGVHWSFRAISAIALVWNVVGVINYFVQMNPAIHRCCDNSDVIANQLR